jgi:hypothetical protein
MAITFMPMPSTVSKVYTLLVLVFFLAGCATIPLASDRYLTADKVATINGFNKDYIKSGNFILTSYCRLKNKGAPIHIYIEGDGVSWISRTLLSDDPTPREPLVLELASMDDAENIAYLARPGQYCRNGEPDCAATYWSDKRFSGEVIDAINKAIDVLRDRTDAKEIDLIGYSGGAAIAVLAASRRQDIASIRTIAGNLDTEAVNSYNKVSQMKGSFNPIDEVQKLSKIRIHHFVGKKDKVVPFFITERFAQKAGDINLSTITVVYGVSHSRGWKEKWKDLLKIPL